ncbi:MAG: hypothetical protein RL417_70 [Pseudomonadota bacterium]
MPVVVGALAPATIGVGFAVSLILGVSEGARCKVEFSPLLERRMSECSGLFPRSIKDKTACHRRMPASGRMIIGVSI